MIFGDTSRETADNRNFGFPPLFTTKRVVPEFIQNYQKSWQLLVLNAGVNSPLHYADELEEPVFSNMEWMKVNSVKLVDQKCNRIYQLLQQISY